MSVHGVAALVIRSETQFPRVAQPLNFLVAHARGFKRGDYDIHAVRLRAMNPILAISTCHLRIPTPKGVPFMAWFY